MKQTITVDLKWYALDQNNSGGYFYRNEDVMEYVFIQALSPEDAESRARDITENYSSYCDCCGERWNIWFRDEDGTEEPEIYGTEITELDADFFRSAAVLYYFDGTKRYYKFGVGFVPYDQLGDDD